MAKPIIVATSAHHNNPLNETNCGILIDRNNIILSAQKIKDFSQLETKKLMALGLEGQQYVLKYATIKKLVSKLENFLNGLT